MLATRRSVAVVAAKLWSLNPRKGFTATKCLSGQSGAILPQARVIAISMAPDPPAPVPRVTAGTVSGSMSKATAMLMNGLR